MVYPQRILPSRILSQYSYILVAVSELCPQRPKSCRYYVIVIVHSLQAELVSSVEQLIPKKILPGSVQHWFTVKSEKTVTLNHKFRNVLEVLRSMMWGDIRYASADIFGISQLTSVSLSPRFYYFIRSCMVMFSRRCLIKFSCSSGWLASYLGILQSLVRSGNKATIFIVYYQVNRFSTYSAVDGRAAKNQCCMNYISNQPELHSTAWL